MAKSFRASGRADSVGATSACRVTTEAGAITNSPTGLARDEGRLRVHHSTARRQRVEAGALVVLFALIVLAARNGATLWQLPHSVQAPKAATETAPVTPDPATAQANDLRRKNLEQQRLAVAQLRTDVGNVLGDVEESRWSLATLKSAGPTMDRLIAQARAAGRPDLAIYWRAIAEHLECGRLKFGGERALAQLMLARAAKHLGELRPSATQADSTLRGDVISTIGAFLGEAKALGFGAQSALVDELSGLRHRLKVEDAAAQQAAAKPNQR